MTGVAWRIDTWFLFQSPCSHLRLTSHYGPAKRARIVTMDGTFLNLGLWFCRFQTQEDSFSISRCVRFRYELLPCYENPVVGRSIYNLFLIKIVHSHRSALQVVVRVASLTVVFTHFHWVSSIVCNAVKEIKLNMAALSFRWMIWKKKCEALKKHFIHSLVLLFREI